MQLEKAINTARRIRRNLLRNDRNPRDLNGLCGLASLILAIELDDLSSLRVGEDHAWNTINGVIIDITATQFNYIYHRKNLKGILVTKKPLEYHRPVLQRGRAAYKYLLDWYNSDDYGRWNQIAAYKE